jgi:hypothetical protein
MQSNTSYADDDVNDDPLFTNAGAGDFTLQSGSPCLEVGTILSSPYDVGLSPISNSPDDWPNNVATKQWVGVQDIGAYAHSSIPPSEDVEGLMEEEYMLLLLFR